MKKIDFYYFTGTGNTYLVVEKMREIFEKYNIKVNLHRIEKVKPENIKIEDTLGLAFPVSMQGTYPFLWDFVRRLPNVHNVPVFMVDTLHLFSGGIIGPMGKILRRKGYRTVGAKEIKMPSNLLRKKIDKKSDRQKIEKGLYEAERYVKELISENTRWGYIPLFSDIISLISQKEITWKIFRKFFKMGVEKDKCINCGLCGKLCPVENITHTDFPIHKDGCYFCMRCLSFCPHKAIHIGNFKIEPYQGAGLLEVFKDLQ